MELARHRANQLLQPRLHRHVDVFVFAAELEAPSVDLIADSIQALDDGLGLFVRENAHGAEHVGMGLACADVFGVEAPVDMEGGVDLLHDLGGLRLKAPAPHFVCGHLVSFVVA